ncbi:MAG: alpha/beta fold hydrolase [Deltaproteobacteria bacterium]|nr:alpha/beta fold hydrolase [Deltaproteobacteria bacterium]
MPKILSNGIQLHYEEMGSGPETIVFSHSYLADHYHFNPQMQALKDRYRCIAFDHRGHGQSEIPDDGYDMENLYEDAVGFIEALDCAPCHFVGLSTGGFIGVRIGNRRPDLVKSLVLMDTSADAEPEEAVRQYHQMLFVVRWVGYWPVIGRVMPIFFASKFLNDPARQDQVKEWKRRFMANDRKAIVKFGNGIFGRTSCYEELDKIQTPTLVMVGAEDSAQPLAKAERIANKIPGATLRVIPDSAHLCTVEEPAAVTSAIEEFLSTQT